MKARSKKFLSLLLASAMVFTMNTTVFAEEVAVDSVDEAVEATVDAAEEIAADATVDEVDVDAATDESVNPTYNSVSAANYFMKDDKGEWNTKVTYDSDDNVTIANVYSPASWNEIVEYGTAGSRTYGAGSLIETVLTGSYNTDTYLSNSKQVQVSSNSTVGVPGLSYGYRTYDVEDLGNGYFLFVGYGSTKDNDPDQEVVDGVAGFAPVIEWDGRAIDWAKSGYWKATNSKEEALDVDIALGKYENNTLTKIKDFKVKKVKVDKKNAKHATVSGQSVDVEYAKGKTEAVWVGLSGYENPTFTITASIPKEVKDLKKTINNILKDKKYAFAISQKNVAAYFDGLESVKSKLFADTTNGLSANNIEDWKLSTYTVDKEEIGLANGLAISKFDASKGKATVTLTVETYNGKKQGEATITLKSGKKDAEYEFTDGTLAGQPVKVLKFVDNGNYAYYTKANGYDPDPSINSNEVYYTLAANGYKFAFEQTPTTDSKKKAKTFRGGIFADTNNGFVYNVED